MTMPLTCLDHEIAKQISGEEACAVFTYCQNSKSRLRECKIIKETLLNLLKNYKTIHVSSYILTY